MRLVSPDELESIDSMKDLPDVVYRLVATVRHNEEQALAREAVCIEAFEAREIVDGHYEKPCECWDKLEGGWVEVDKKPCLKYEDQHERADDLSEKARSNLSPAALELLEIKKAWVRWSEIVAEGKLDEVVEMREENVEMKKFISRVRTLYPHLVDSLEKKGD